MSGDKDSLNGGVVEIGGFSGGTAEYEPLRVVISNAVRAATADPKTEAGKKARYKLEDERARKAEELWLKWWKFDTDFSKENLKRHKKEFETFLSKFGLTTASLAKIINGISLIREAVSVVGKEVVKESKKRMDWLSELEKAGVHLTKGFDNSFTELANTAKMSHDEFAKMLTANSKTIARMNAINIDGAKTFAESLNKSVGRFGYTTEEASTALSSYMDNVTNFYSKESLSEKLKNDATTQYLRNLKELSAATGKSVELLTQENQLKENTLFAKKLQNQYPEIYQWLKEAGHSDEMIKSLVTGIPTQESVMYQATPQGRSNYVDTQRLIRGVMYGTIRRENFGKEYNKILSNGNVDSMRAQIENMPFPMASIFDRSGLSQTLAVGNLKNGFDMNAAGDVVSNSGDTEYLNDFNKYKAEKNQLINNWNKAVAFSAKHTSDALDLLTIGLKFANKSLMIFGASLAYTLIASKTGLVYGIARHLKTILSPIVKSKGGTEGWKESYNILKNDISSVGRGLRLFNEIINTTVSNFGVLGKSLSILAAGVASFAAGFGISKLAGASDRTALFSGTGSTIGGYIGMGIGAFFGMAPLGWIAGSILGGLAGAGIASLTDKKSTGPATSTDSVDYKNEYAYNKIETNDSNKSDKVSEKIDTICNCLVRQTNITEQSWTEMQLQSG